MRSVAPRKSFRGQKRLTLNLRPESQSQSAQSDRAQQSKARRGNLTQRGGIMVVMCSIITYMRYLTVDKLQVLRTFGSVCCLYVMPSPPSPILPPSTLPTPTPLTCMGRIPTPPSPSRKLLQRPPWVASANGFHSMRRRRELSQWLGPIKRSSLWCVKIMSLWFEYLGIVSCGFPGGVHSFQKYAW